MSIRTPKAILSYPHLFQPNTFGGGEPKYSCSLVFEAGTDLSELKKAALDCAVEKWGEKAKGMIRSGELRMPFREEWEKKGYPEGSVFINVRSKRQPGVVSIFPGPDGRPLPINSENEIYPGCIVKATVGVFAYNHSGNKGVAFGLNNVQKVADGDRLDSRRDAADDFEAELTHAAELPTEGDDDFGF